jgi:hypothetical protein
MAYDNSNRFSLNKNQEKRDDKDRDYLGTVNAEGREFWLSGYITQGPNGAFISGTVKRKDAMPAERRDRISSDVPF